MRFYKIIKLTTLFLFLSHALFAQISNDQDIFKGLPEHLFFQVKQLDQFIARFNSNENAEGIRIDAKNTSQEDRAKVLASLFNLELLENKLFKTKALKFIKEVSGSDIRNLSFYDKDYFATVNCHVLYHNKKETLTLTLTVEGDADKGIKWAIIGAQANFLQTKTDKKSNGIIPPTNHEVEFIHLLEVFNGKNDISNYISEKHTPNELDALAYILKNEELKMISTSIPTYHFLQIPGWVFTVDFYNRNSKNSGWLISHLEEVGKEELFQYKMNKLFILP